MGVRGVAEMGAEARVAAAVGAGRGAAERGVVERGGDVAKEAQAREVWVREEAGMVAAAMVAPGWEAVGVAVLAGEGVVRGGAEMAAVEQEAAARVAGDVVALEVREGGGVAKEERAAVGWEGGCSRT